MNISPVQDHSRNHGPTATRNRSNTNDSNSTVKKTNKRNVNDNHGSNYDSSPPSHPLNLSTESIEEIDKKDRGGNSKRINLPQINQSNSPSRGSEVARNPYSIKQSSLLKQNKFTTKQLENSGSGPVNSNS